MNHQNDQNSLRKRSDLFIVLLIIISTVWYNITDIIIFDTCKIEPTKYLNNIIPDFSEQLIPLLTLPDCEVVIATLEALNALAKSPMGVSLLKNESISLLVDLLSFSSRNYDISGSRFYGPRKEAYMWYELYHMSLIDVTWSSAATHFMWHLICIQYKTSRNHSSTTCRRTPYS